MPLSPEMDHIQEFTTRFGQLVWLLVHRTDDIAAQKDALRAAMHANREIAIALSTTDLHIQLSAARSSDASFPLHELCTRLSNHSVRQLHIAAGAPAAEVLGLARCIADEPHTEDEGEAFDARLMALNATAVQATLGPNGFTRVATPPPTPHFVRMPTPRATPVVGRRTPSASGMTAASSRSTPAAGAGLPVAPPRSTPAVGAPRVTRFTPAATGTVRPTPAVTPLRTPAIPDESVGMYTKVMASSHTTPPRGQDLLAQLEEGMPLTNVVRVLDDLVAIADEHASRGEWELVGRIMQALVQGEHVASVDPEARRLFTLAIRRLITPTNLRALAGLLPRHPEQRDGLHAVFARSGPVGAETLIELLTAADSPTDRRAYLAALAKTRDAVPALIHSLGDPRWFVVRNAIDVLGEMQASEAEVRLAELMSHAEDRVRRSSSAALARIGSARALQSAQQGLSDPVKEVRLQVATALGQTKNPRVVPGLASALDSEHDAEVQAAILAALGRVGSRDAVTRLVKAAEPEGRLFRRKPSALRVAAVHALGSANTPQSLAAVQKLADDRDREVRDAARRVLATRAPDGEPSGAGD